MFSPNTDSFVFIRSTIVKRSDPAFLPYTDSFVFIRTTTVVTRSFPVFPHVLLPNTHSFLLTQGTIVEPRLAHETENEAAAIPQSTDSINSPQADSEQGKVTDQSRRNFLKVAGIAGAGLVVSQLSPNKAHALIMGSSPTTGVVGVKNSTNTRINPATEETASSLLNKVSDLTFDTGSLQVKVTSLPAAGSGSFSDSGGVDKKGRVDDTTRHVYVDVKDSVLPTSASTETTLQTISFGGFKFTLRLETVGDIDYVGEAPIGTLTSADDWRIKRINSASGVIIQWAGTGVFDQVWDDRANPLTTYS